MLLFVFKEIFISDFEVIYIVVRECTIKVWSRDWVISLYLFEM